MKCIPWFRRVLAGWFLVAALPGLAQSNLPNTLSDRERTEGWKLLFDGQTTQGWRGFKAKTFPAQGWEVRDGWLRKIANVQGGDIVSVEEYADFELTWEWTIEPKGNNGVKYFISESRDGAVGHEYQMMDDMGVEGKHSTASFYDVLPPLKDKPMQPAGKLNVSRILVRGDHVEHWLNGSKVLEYELGGEQVLQAVAKSKFKGVQGFGTKMKGRILLTDHKDGAAFRNIKMRVP